MRRIIKIMAVCSMLLLVPLFTFGCASGNNDKKQQSEIDYPTGPIQMIVPFGAGGGTDILARLISNKLEQVLGKPIVIVNKPGAGGEIAANEVLKAKPDGYTLLFNTFPSDYIVTASRETKYKMSDFIPIASFNSTPACLIVSKNVPYKNLNDFVKYAKEHPGEITVALVGDAHMLTLVQLEKSAGIKLSPITFKSGSESLNALLGGHVNALITGLQFAGTARDQGCQVLAAASAERMEGYTDIPTFKEIGLNVETILIRYLLADKDTPEPVIKKLMDACDSISKDTELKDKIEKGGDIYKYTNSNELQQYMAGISNEITALVEENKNRFMEK